MPHTVKITITVNNICRYPLCIATIELFVYLLHQKSEEYTQEEGTCAFQRLIYLFVVVNSDTSSHTWHECFSDNQTFMVKITPVKGWTSYCSF